VVGLESPLAGPFSLSLAPGETAVVTGASGSGKSLFLRMVADLDPGSGRVELDGIERAAIPPPEWRRRVVYVAAEAGWWSDGVREHFPAERLEEAKALAVRLRLSPDLLEARVARLSTGERQRLAIVRGLLVDPQILLLDEPTSALDEAATSLTEDLLRDLTARGLALILVTHDLALAARFGGARYEMAERKLVRR
jgi:ABC-type iron transport system FetAB ATPase subunit